MKKRKSSAIHPAGCPNGPHQMAIIDPQLFGPVDDCVLLQASGDGMRNAGISDPEHVTGRRLEKAEATKEGAP